jgi:hypothetical protein
MNVVLWIVQAVLALLCVAGGGYQLTQFAVLRTEVAAMRELPQPLWMVLATVGCVAGVLLIVPGLVGKMPQLVPIAAAIVVVHSGLISAFYLTYGDRPPLPYAIAMTLMAAFVAVGRWFVAPL